MATPRSNFVKLRLTDLEKADWTAAAGGTRKLSEWIRQVCNAECAATLDKEEQDAALAAQARLEAARTPLHVLPIPNAKPVIVGDAIKRSVEDQAHRESRSLPGTEASGADSSPGDRTSVPSTGDGSGCPRWMHHRPGVYCGACKRVIGR